MKRVLTIVFLLVLNFTLKAQILQKQNTYGIGFNRTGADTLIYIPSDTLSVPSWGVGKTHIARKGTTLYYWDGTKWSAISGSGSNYTAGYGLILNANEFKADTATLFPAVRGTIPAYTAPTLQQVYTASSGNPLTSYHNINMGSQYIDYSNVGTVMFATAGGTELEISNDFIDMYTQTGTAPNRLRAFHNVSTNEIRTYMSDNSGDFISDLPSIRMFRNDSSLTINSKKVIIDGGILNIDNTQVGIGTSSPNASALLDVTSTTKGAVMPRMNTTQMNAISSPVAGLMVYNSDSTSYFYYNGSVWLNMGSGSGATSPGGSTKQFQYNNAGAFAGSGMLTQETNQILVTGVSDATTIPFAVEAHEDLTAPIIVAAQSGVKKFALHSNGSLEMADVSAPGTPASGYGRWYVRDDSARFVNDGGTEFTLGRATGGGSPGGSNKQVQYNNSGSFGGAAGLEVTNSNIPVRALSQATTDTVLQIKTVASQTGDPFNIVNQNNKRLFAINSSGFPQVYDGAGNTVANFRVNSGVGMEIFNTGGLGMESWGVVRLKGSSLPMVGKMAITNSGAYPTANHTVDVQGSFGAAITTTSTNLTLDDTHHTVIVTSGTPTITLPAAASGNSRRIYVVVNQTGSGVTISSYLDFTGAGNTTVAANSAIKIQSNGTNWYRIL